MCVFRDSFFFQTQWAAVIGGVSSCLVAQKLLLCLQEFANRVFYRYFTPKWRWRLLVYRFRFVRARRFFISTLATLGRCCDRFIWSNGCLVVVVTAINCVDDGLAVGLLTSFNFAMYCTILHTFRRGRRVLRSRSRMLSRRQRLALAIGKVFVGLLLMKL